MSLSDYTTAWQLYLGLFFMAVVLFAPGGLAGLIADAQAGRCARAHSSDCCARTRSLALPALVAGDGRDRAASRSTIAARRSPRRARGCALFWIDMDTSTPWPWLAALALLAIGASLFRASLAPRRGAWERATEVARTTAGGPR